MTKAAQRRQQKNRLAIFHLALRGTRHRRTTNTHPGRWPSDKLTIGPRTKLAHDRIQHLDPESFHFRFRNSSDVDPQIIECCYRRIRNTTTLQMRTLDDDNSRHLTCARQYSDSLSFVKLDPQRMLPAIADLAQSQITSVSNFSDSKTRPIKRTRNHASRIAAAFPQDEIAERIAFPTRHRAHDRVGR